MGSLFDITINSASLIALAQVILIDVTLAGDNAVVIGMVAHKMAPENRNKVIFWGLAATVILLIVLASLVTQLLQILGLTLAGGVLLLWVSWRLYRDLRESKEEAEALEPAADSDATAPPAKTAFVGMPRAIFQIVVADLSMSLDNVLAVAGAAQKHTWVLIVGLTLSITLTGVAAVFIAKILHRYPWISYIGLLMIVYVSAKMIWQGAFEVAGSLS